jgi:hypothetical protein
MIRIAQDTAPISRPLERDADRRPTTMSTGAAVTIVDSVASASSLSPAPCAPTIQVPSDPATAHVVDKKVQACPGCQRGAEAGEAVGDGIHATSRSLSKPKPQVFLDRLVYEIENRRLSDGRI